MDTATAPAAPAPANAAITPANVSAPEPFTAGRDRKPRVLVIGGGFGGLEAVKALKHEDMDITLIDRSNHHLFQPLLYQVATAGLTPANIARPLREIFASQKNVEVILTEAKRIDVNARKVITEDLVLDYDYLVLATGARHSYFGHDEWEKFAPGLKNLADAVEIRKRMLVAFEVAEKALDQGERDAAMTFIIVGGGPTGVEMAGAISEIARHTMTKDFRRINSRKSKVIIIEGAPRILAGFAPDLSVSAKKQLNDIGVEVHEGLTVTQVTDHGVEVKGGQFIPARTIVWAAGNAASPIGKTLGVPLDRAGRVIVNEDLTIPGHPEIQVVGDTANFTQKDGKPVPGVSPAAMQMGRHAAANIREMVAGGTPMTFSYWDKGSLATIGRNKAVADMHIIRFGGFFAWAAWACVHIFFLIGFRNRLTVMGEWIWNYITFYRGSRLITGTQEGQESLQHPAPGSEPDGAPATPAAVVVGASKL